MARLLRSNGVDIEPFAARHLTEDLLKDADLVLTLTRAQRSLVVNLWPPAVRRAFTVREFARLLEHIDPFALPAAPPAKRLRTVTPLAAAKRGFERSSIKDDDVVDPYHLSDDVYAASFAEITAAVKVIVATIVIGRA